MLYITEQSHEARCLTRSLIAALIVMALASCSSTPPDRIAYNTIDDGVTAVQSAATAYRRDCNVPVGGTGPGTCDATEFAKAADIYVKFQATANKAVEIASKTGQTPLQIVSAAAAAALELYASFKK